MPESRETEGTSRRLDRRPAATIARPPILVIDPQGGIADALRRPLRQQGHQVLTAGSGEQGLELFHAEPPVLVVVELDLPRLSGFDVCRIIRGQSPVRIIALTARGTDADTVAALEMGADDVLHKPVQPAELLSRVRAQLRRSPPTPPERDPPRGVVLRVRTGGGAPRRRGS